MTHSLPGVYSYDALGSFLAIPVGQVAVGPLALTFGTGPTLLAGAGLVLLTVAGMLTNPGVRRLDSGPAEVETSGQVTSGQETLGQEVPLGVPHPASPAGTPGSAGPAGLPDESRGRPAGLVPGTRE